MPISASKGTVGDQATSMRNWYQSHKILKSTLISGPKMPPRLFKEIPSLTVAQWGQFGFLSFLPPEEKEKTTDLTSRCALSRVLWGEGAPQRREGGGIIVSWDGVSYSSNNPPPRSGGKEEREMGTIKGFTKYMEKYSNSTSDSF